MSNPAQHHSPQLGHEATGKSYYDTVGKAAMV